MEALYRRLLNAAADREYHIGYEILKQMDVERKFLIVSQWKNIEGWST